MIRTTILASAAVLTAQSAFAAGLDRTFQPVGIIFETGNYAEFSFAATNPSLTGTDVLANPISNVGNKFSSLGGGLKVDFTDAFSLSLIAEKPYGADIAYGGDPATTLLGGTTAIATSTSVTAIGRYKFSERFSVHAGVRHQTISGDITLSGLAYDPPGPGNLSGYNVALSPGSATGYVVGGAFEIPDIAARVALTYNSEITHSLPTVETISGLPVFGPSANTELKSPASINLDFQTGINPKTLLFGSVRYVKWSDLKISPSGFDAAVSPGTAGDSIASLDDSITLNVGVGRRLSEKLSVSATVGYEYLDGDDLVSPLSPTKGNWSVGVGARYQTGPVTVSGGIRYTKFGDSMPETGTPDVARASFTGNDAVTVGMKIGFHF